MILRNVCPHEVLKRYDLKFEYLTGKFCARTTTATGKYSLFLDGNEQNMKSIVDYCADKVCAGKEIPFTVILCGLYASYNQVSRKAIEQYREKRGGKLSVKEAAALLCDIENMTEQIDTLLEVMEEFRGEALKSYIDGLEFQILGDPPALQREIGFKPGLIGRRRFKTAEKELRETFDVLYREQIIHRASEIDKEENQFKPENKHEFVEQ